MTARLRHVWLLGCAIVVLGVVGVACAQIKASATINDEMRRAGFSSVTSNVFTVNGFTIVTVSWSSDATNESAVDVEFRLAREVIWQKAPIEIDELALTALGAAAFTVGPPTESYLKDDLVRELGPRPTGLVKSSGIGRFLRYLAVLVAVAAIAGTVLVVWLVRRGSRTPSPVGPYGAMPPGWGQPPPWGQPPVPGPPPVWGQAPPWAAAPKHLGDWPPTTEQQPTAPAPTQPQVPDNIWLPPSG